MSLPRPHAPHKPRFNLACALLLATALSACASGPKNANEAEDFADAAGQAAVTPLADLNLIRKQIPPVLLQAQQQPYAPPAASGCLALATEILALDAALGADLDTPESADKPSLIQRGTGLASDATVDAIRHSTDVLPFRGWIRKLSGAAKHERKITAAIAAGGIRRAYLKGLGQAQHCANPAAPLAAPLAAAQK